MMKTVSVSMSLTPPLVDRLDQQRRLFAKRFGWLSRSALVRLAVVEWLDRNEDGAEEDGGGSPPDDGCSPRGLSIEHGAPLQ